MMKQGDLEHLRDLEESIKVWVKSTCPICGKEYLHSRHYKPETCLRKECVCKRREQQQAEDRCHRIGQKDTVNVYYIVADKSIDARIAQTYIKKSDKISQITDIGLDDNI